MFSFVFFVPFCGQSNMRDPEFSCFLLLILRNKGLNTHSGSNSQNVELVIILSNLFLFLMSVFHMILNRIISRYNEKISLYTEKDFLRHPHTPDSSSEPIEGHVRHPFRQDVFNLSRCIEFRRLKGKTQLFPEGDSDRFRDRLTHTLEVSHIARDIVDRLNREAPFCFSVDKGGWGPISLYLIKHAALLHDLGIPPYGHDGESALNALMSEMGGFESNAQTLRIVTGSPRRSYYIPPNPNHSCTAASDGTDARIGLNLCYRSILAVLKYDKLIPEVIGHNGSLIKGYYPTEQDRVERAKDAVYGKKGWNPEEMTRSLECSIMDVADDIENTIFDIEDSMKANLLQVTDFLNPNQSILQAIQDDLKLRGYEISHEWIRMSLHNFAVGMNEFILSTGRCFDVKANIEPYPCNTSVLDTTDWPQENHEIRNQYLNRWMDLLIANVHVKINEEVPALSMAFLDFRYEKVVQILKSFVFHSVTRSAPLQKAKVKAHRVIETLFQAFLKNPKLLPHPQQKLVNRIGKGDEGKNGAGRNLFHRIIADYICSLTDESALRLYHQL